MLTHNSTLLPTLTGDWKADGPKLLNALHRLFLALNSPHALKITEAQLENVTIDDSSLTSVSSLHMAGTLDLDGNPLAIDADADTYLYTSADDVVRLSVAASDHTIWNSTGLGLGVVPSYKMHIGSGQYAGPDGTAAAPTYSFASSGNADNGLFLSSNKPAISTNGTQVCLFDTDKLTLAAGYHVTSATATGTTPAIQSGTYTPTLTNTTNITSSTSNADVRWVRVGNVVKVSGYVNARPTAAGACALALSIPIASSLAATTELTGVCHLSTDAGGYILGDTTNDRATLSFKSGAAYPVEAPVAFEFSYEVL